MIPAFNQHDNLPAGEHHTTWQEFVQHFSWNTHRATLIGGLRAALIALQTCGCETAWIDGSFATRKTNPNDIDVAWDDETTDFDLLEQLEPTFWILRTVGLLKNENLVVNSSQPHGKPTATESPSSSISRKIETTTLKALFGFR